MKTVLKHSLDKLAAGIGIVVLSPVLLLVAAGVKLTSAGPVVFRQARVGQHGRLFVIFKFRTMYHRRAAGGLCVTAKCDKRITPFGRLLRRTKIDELPQLVNVLRGEMSLVGPRPEVPAYVRRFSNLYDPILRVRPGITHRASILFRDEESILDGAQDPDRMYTEEILPRKLAIYQRDLDRDGLLDDIRTILDTIFPHPRTTADDSIGQYAPAARISGNVVEARRSLHQVEEHRVKALVP